jgi:hypothetical protein
MSLKFSFVKKKEYRDAYTCHVVGNIDVPVPKYINYLGNKDTLIMNLLDACQRASPTRITGP